MALLLNRSRIVAVTVGMCFFLLAGCAKGPTGPQPGTPAFFWQAAKETWAAKDYIKTADHLAQILRTENEFTKPAAVMRLVLTSGLVKAYMELADNYEEGARANTIRPMPLRKVSSDYMRLAEVRALEFGETYLKFAKGLGDENIKLDFTFPSADMTEIKEIKKIVAGTLPDEATIAAVERKKLDQSMVRAVCQAVGAPNDVAKAQAAFASGAAEVPRDVFILAMVNNLYDQATLFSRKKLDNPQRLEMFVNEAREALKAVKDPKATKDLAARLDKLLRENKAK